MDISEAMKHIKKAIDEEIPHLKQLNYDNQKYSLWHSKMCNVLEAAFNKTSDEYIKFSRAKWQALKHSLKIFDELQQSDYMDNLTQLEVILKSTIHKYEMLEVEDKSATIGDVAESPEDFEESQEKQSLGRESRKHLQGTPEEIAPHIVRVAQEFQFQGFKYLAQELSYKSSQHSKYFQILCGEYIGPQISFGVDAEDDKHPKNRHIGEIILQSLPNTRTVFISREKSGDLVNAALYFNSFLERLSLEFKNLGVEETTLRKTWRRFSGIIELWNKLKP